MSCPSAVPPSAATVRWGHVWALWVAAAAVQVAVIARAVVPAQDAVRFVQTAQQMERVGMRAAAESPDRPLYPAVLLAVRRVESFLGLVKASQELDAPESSSRVLASAGDWVWTAQCTAGALAVLSVVVLYFLLRQLVASTAAFLGALLFGFLSETARLGADALSDSTQLFLLCCAAWAILKSWPGAHAAGASGAAGAAGKPGWPWLLLAGLLIGVGGLCRREILLLIPAWLLAEGFVLLYHNRGAEAERANLPARRTLAAAAALTLGLAAGATPAIWLTRGDLPAAVARIVQQQPLQQHDITGSLRQWKWRTDDGQRMAFPKKDPQDSLRHIGAGDTFKEWLTETAQAGDYWLWGLAVMGAVARSRRSARSHPHGTCGLPRAVDFAVSRWSFVASYFLLHGGACLVYSASMGYLAARHLLPLAAVCSGLAAEGLMSLATLLALCSRGLWRRSTPSLQVGPRPGTALLAVAIIALNLPHALSSPHASRAAHRRAGDWLARQAPSQLVLDTRGWTGLYSGHATVTYDQAMGAFAHRDLGYVVVERHELERDTVRSKTLQALLRHAGERVAVFPAAAPHKSVEIYRWRPSKFDERFAKHKPAAPHSVVDAADSATERQAEAAPDTDPTCQDRE